MLLQQHILWLHQHIEWLQHHIIVLQQRMDALELDAHCSYISQNFACSQYIMPKTCEVGTQCVNANIKASTQRTDECDAEEKSEKTNGVRWHLLAATLLTLQDSNQILDIQAKKKEKFVFGEHDDGDDVATELIDLARKCEMRSKSDDSQNFLDKALCRGWRDLFVCSCMRHNKSLIKDKETFLSFLDHEAFERKFARPRKKTSHGRRKRGEEEEVRCNCQQKEDLHSQVVSTWTRICASNLKPW